ncbi:DUF3127 domain-containing protein [Larkinella arboricola]|uniref:Uncharacterized protein DUF3127 n=1 Tax=Larkinella arboricola TaxID=643671 RepID=A0A327X245_LARAB|nr:DUF3127 domain-containing protein [Larkinella arboricola]RAK00456.1 uncharacterized protein DUF3127 [Larkinella arboricola]
MALELTGKLVKVLPEQSGQGKNGTWTKQQFVIETIDQFPKQVCLMAWGDKTGDLAQFAPGDTLRCAISVESREYNDRWYTDVRAWRIEPADGAEAMPAPTAAPRRSDAAPRPAASSQPLTSFEEDDNALPF